MTTLMNTITKLCPPAMLYLILSVISISVLFHQNYKEPSNYCVGKYTAKSLCNNKVYFLFKIIYVIFWLYVLQKLCKNGYTTLSWILVLLPIIVMFILVGILLTVLMNK